MEQLSSARRRLAGLCLLLLSALPTLAQPGVRIGAGAVAAPDASAALDIVSTAKGVLVPRMLKAERTGIASPADGLLVFQTDAPTGFPAGFWYYQGGSWQQLPTATGKEFWKADGNAGTSPGSQFLGTTDGQDLAFKTQGTERLRLKVSGALWMSMAGGNTALGNQTGAALTASAGSNTLLGEEAGKLVSTGDNNTFVGAYAGSANTTGTANTLLGASAGNSLTGSDNTMLGTGAGYFTTSNFNTFVGSGTGNSNSSGFNNTFLGCGAGLTNATGSNNTLLGRESGRLGAGSGRTMIGSFNGQTDRTGTNLTLLGYGSDVTGSALTNAGAIGYQALVSQNNSLVLGGTAGQSTAIKVGIGTSAPSQELEVAGGLQVSQLTTQAAAITQTTNTQAQAALSFQQYFTMPVTGGTITSVSVTAGVAATGVGLRIFDGAGVVVAQTVTLAVGNNTFAVTPATVPPGQYYLQVSRATAITLRLGSGNPYPGNDLVIDGLTSTTLDLVFSIAYTATGPGATPTLLATSSGNVGINEAVPAATLHVGGAASTVRLEGLAGAGTRLLTADASGNVASQAQPTISLSGQTLTLTSGASTSTATLSSGAISRYGDGSAGAINITVNTNWAGSPSAAALNGQFTTFTVAAGVTLTVPSGTIFRCTGAATINGQIVVQPGTSGKADFGPGAGIALAPATTLPGGAGALPPGRITQARLPLGGEGGGAGGHDLVVNGPDGGAGGGSFSLLAAGNLTVSSGGTIEANGGDGEGATTTVGAAGGGAGGVITLVSRGTISLSGAGAVAANGGAGGDGAAIANTLSRGGGGGGGGSIRLYAATISGAANAAINGGAAGAAVTTGTGAGRQLSFGGGASGGDGGRGGSSSVAGGGGIAGSLINVATANPENVLP
jgi:hypothetical protein